MNSLTMNIRKRENKAKRVAAFALAILFMVTALPLVELGGLFAVSAAQEDGGLSGHVIDTVSPNHVTFNLFDYWVDKRDSRYNQNWGIQDGINQGHPFLFSGGGAGRGPWNVWTGNASHYNATHKEETRYGVYPGIVNQSLQNGYPALAP